MRVFLCVWLCYICIPNVMHVYACISWGFKLKSSRRCCGAILSLKRPRPKQISMFMICDECANFVVYRSLSVHKKLKYSWLWTYVPNFVSLLASLSPPDSVSKMKIDLSPANFMKTSEGFSSHDTALGGPTHTHTHTHTHTIMLKHNIFQQMWHVCEVFGVLGDV